MVEGHVCARDDVITPAVWERCAHPDLTKTLQNWL